MPDKTPRISAQDAKTLLKRTGFSGTRARRTPCLSGHTHPSKGEAGLCDWLLARKQHREIADYTWKHRVPLAIRPAAGRAGQRFWEVDFLVKELDGSQTLHEAKGWNRRDGVYEMKRDAYLFAHPEAKLYVNKELWTGERRKKKSTWTMAAARKAQHVSGRASTSQHHQ